MIHSLHTTKEEIIEDLPNMIEAHRASLADRYGVRKEYAEEAVFRGFVGTWEKLAEIDNPAFFQYFYMAAKNALLNMMRDDSAKVPVETEPSYEMNIEVTDIDRLDQIAHKLPDRYKQLFELSRKGRSQKYIARKMGTSHGNVRTMKHRMIQYCRALVLVLLLPVFALAQEPPLDVHDVVRKGYYRVIVDDDTMAERYNRFDTAVIGAMVYAQSFALHEQLPEIQIAGPDWEMKYSFHYGLEDETGDSTQTVITHESPALRNVRWLHDRAVGDSLITVWVKGESQADFVTITFGGDIAKVVPDSAFNVPFSTDSLDTLDLTVQARKGNWNVSWSDTLNMALLDTLGGLPSIADFKKKVDSTMALPSTGYDLATVTNPATDLVGPVLYVKMADLSADFWSAVDTSDGTKLRVAIDGSETELAFDVQEFDDVAETGHLWVKWSGTLASTGTQKVRVYPAKAANSSYAATDTYGSQAVWVDYAGVWHMNGTADATGNGNSLITEAGSPTLTAGKFGDSYNYDGNDAHRVADNATLDIANNLTVSLWFNSNSLPSTDNHTHSFKKNAYGGTSHRTNGDHNTFIREGGTRGFIGPSYASAGLSTGTWYMVHQVCSTDTLYQYFDGVSRGTPESWNGTFDQEDDPFYIATNGYGGEFVDEKIEEVRIATIFKSEDHASFEYDNQNDPATFWGTWTWQSTSISGTASLTGSPGAVSLSGAVEAAASAALSGDPQQVASQGNIAIDGNASFGDVAAQLLAEGGLRLGASKDITGGVGEAAASGTVKIAGRGDIAGVGQLLSALAAVKMTGTIIFEDTSASAAVEGTITLAGIAGIAGQPGISSMDGILSIAGDAAAMGTPGQASLIATLTLSGVGALADAPGSIAVTGSFSDILTAAVALTGSAGQMGAEGTLSIAVSAEVANPAGQMDAQGAVLIGADGQLTGDSQILAAQLAMKLAGSSGLSGQSGTIDIDSSLLLAASGSLQDNPQAIEAVAGVIVSMSMALADEPGALLAQEIVISEKTRLLISAERVGSSVSVSGQRVEGPSVAAPRADIIGDKVEHSEEVN